MSFRFTLYSLFILLSITPFLSAAELSENNQAATDVWPSYPQTLLQFDYSGDLLQQNWSVLAAGIQLPWPDSQFVKQMMEKFPHQSKELLLLAEQPNSHPALAPILQQNYQPLAEAVQQVWRLHYQGQYQQAFKLGKALGPAGLMPALYAKMIHTTFLVEKDNKEEKFLEIDSTLKPLIPLLKGFDFLTFGDAYQKVRRLELLSITAAAASGLISPTQSTLNSLHKKHPHYPLYSAMLAGFYAGIIERVGGFIGSMTYGADEDQVIELFENALLQENRLAVLYNELSQALIRLDDSDYENKLKGVLKTCINLPVYSAEEAMNQQMCLTTYNDRISSND